jgi:hypothetical protein
MTLLADAAWAICCGNSAAPEHARAILRGINFGNIALAFIFFINWNEENN